MHFIVVGLCGNFSIHVRFAKECANWFIDGNIPGLNVLNLQSTQTPIMVKK